MTRIIPGEPVIPESQGCQTIPGEPKVPDKYLESQKYQTIPGELRTYKLLFLKITQFLSNVLGQYHFD